MTFSVAVRRFFSLEETSLHKKNSDWFPTFPWNFSEPAYCVVFVRHHVELGAQVLLPSAPPWIGPTGPFHSRRVDLSQQENLSPTTDTDDCSSHHLRRESHMRTFVGRGHLSMRLLLMFSLYAFVTLKWFRSNGFYYLTGRSLYSKQQGQGEDFRWLTSGLATPWRLWIELNLPEPQWSRNSDPVLWCHWAISTACS